MFRYGVRINPDLVQDLCFGVYLVVVDNLGNQPQLDFLPWHFFPLLNRFAAPLVSKNMDVKIGCTRAYRFGGTEKTPLASAIQLRSHSAGLPARGNFHVNLKKQVLVKGV